MEEKKKKSPNRNANALLFLMFWVVVVSFLQTSSWDLWRNFYDLIADKLPFIFHRLWLVYLLEGIVGGLALGLAQKTAIQAYRPIRLKYWVRITLFLSIAGQIAEYLLIRFVDWKTFEDVSAYFLSSAIVFPSLLLVAQWWILRKHFKQAWLWLLLIIPTIAFLGLTDNYITMISTSVLQAFLAACTLLLMSRQNLPETKTKNIVAAETRLEDKLEDIEDGHDSLSQLYQASDA